MEISHAIGWTILWMSGIVIIPFVLGLSSAWLIDAGIGIVVFWISAILYMVATGIFLVI